MAAETKDSTNGSFETTTHISQQFSQHDEVIIN
jgi:hypothetical protein